MTLETAYIIISASCLGLGLIIGHLCARLGNAKVVRRAENEKMETEKELASLASEYQTFKAQSEKMHTMEMEQLERRYREMAEVSQQRADAAIEKMTAQLSDAAKSMLREREREFREMSAESIEQLMNPLRDSMERMQKSMADNSQLQTDLGATMRTSIEGLMRVSDNTRKSAEELARVFKQGSKVQGDWGETVLDELLESQGLTRGIHYDVQSQITDSGKRAVLSDTGSKMRPDIILHLDKNRDLIIDAKVSMTAFIDYVNADTPIERNRYLKAHIESIEKHVKELASKNYSSYINPPKQKLDYVVMFVPNVGALWTALNAKPDLWRRAMEQNVFIADEQTLYAALRIVSMTWTQIAQAQNHEKVFALADEMIARVGKFIVKHEELGRALAKAQEAYTEASHKLEERGQSIRNTCAKLIKLGAQNNSRTPVRDIENELDEDNAQHSLTR